MIAEQRYILVAETQQERDNRLLERLDESFGGVRKPILSVRLESDTDDLLDAFEEMQAAYMNVQTARYTNALPVSRGLIDPKVIDKSAEIVQTKALEIVQIARKHLERLDQPIREQSPDSTK